MEIKWLGHACFSLFTGKNTIVFDPYAPMGAYGELKATANKVLVSHGHFDHNYEAGVTLTPWVEDTECEISAVASYHDEQHGALRGTNLIHIVSQNGFRVVHLGDLGHMVEGEALEQISGCDLLMIPVGGFYTIDAEVAAELVKRAAPKCVIPMHYRFGEYGPEPISGVEPFLDLIKELYPVDRSDSNVLSDISTLEKGVYVLKFAE